MTSKGELIFYVNEGDEICIGAIHLSRGPDEQHEGMWSIHKSNEKSAIDDICHKSIIYNKTPKSFIVSQAAKPLTDDYYHVFVHFAATSYSSMSFTIKDGNVIRH